MTRSSLHVRAWLALSLTSILVPTLAAAADPASTPAPQPVRRTMRMSAPPVATEGDSARLAARSVGGMLVVPIEVNGHGPHWFAIDTGAMGHGRVNDSLAVKLGLAVAGQARSGDPSGKNAREVNLYRVDSLEIGGVVVRGVVMSGGTSIRRLEGVEGILGVDLFTDLLLAFDYPRSEVRLTRGALPDTNGRDVIGYTREPGPIVLPLRLGKHVLDTDLDTGNTMAPFVFPTAIAEALPRKGEPRDGGVARTAVNEIPIHLVTLAEPVRLGAIEFPNAEVAYPALHERGNIGAKALAGFVLELDQKNKRVRLTRPAKSAK